MSVLLDNGHGYETGGKRSPVWSDGTQLFEWEFNRDIVKRISKELDKLDIRYNIIVPEALDISLQTRCNRINRLTYKYPGSFVVSIHGNASVEVNKGSGWEVWTTTGETESDKIATIFFNHAKVLMPEFKMRSDTVDGDPDKESNFYILKNTNCPAILTENLFYTNEIECRYMLSETGRNIITKLHVDSIVEYVKNS